jgi:hypothetical protein
MPENLSDKPEEPREVVEYFRDTPRPEPVPAEIAAEDAPEEAQASAALTEPEPVPAPPVKSKPKVRGPRLGLYILFGVLICVPAAFVLIVVDLAILCVGAGLAAAGIFTISLGFAGITVFADFMLLFGAGLVIAAIGLPVIFLAVWFFSRAVVGFIDLILHTGGKWCYEHTEEVPEK